MTPETADPQVRTTDRDAIANLRTLVQLCADGKVRCSAKTARPSATTVATVREHLAGGDFYPDEDIAAFAWPLLLQAGGLAKLSGQRLDITPRGRAALQKPVQETIRLLWERWVSHGLIDEFSRIEEIKGQRSKNVLTAVARRRAAVASVVRTLPPGEWVMVDDLFAQMRRPGGPVFSMVRSDRAIWRLYIAEPDYGSLGYAGFHEWSLLEGRYTLAVLLEYAATLGLLDVELRRPAFARDDFRENWGTDDLEALSRYDGLLAIRLNGLGAFATGQLEHFDPPRLAQESTVTVLPNCDLVATGELPAADRLFLSAYGAEVADSIWSVSLESILSAVAAGDPLEEFERFLSDHCAEPVPQSMVALLTDARDRVQRLTDRGTVRQIECQDAATASYIARELRSCCRLVGERSLLVTARQEAAFRARLLRLGHALPPATG